MYKKYVAEFLGTFALAFVVLMVAATDVWPLLGAVIASLTLTLFVYSIGPISGCHINPAVTLAQLSVKKISSKDAILYILAQLVGAIAALLISGLFASGYLPTAEGVFQTRALIAEMLGAAFFCFGIASVVYGKAKEQMSGLVVGGSLLLGVLIATLSGAIGILNPAVAIALLYGNPTLAALYIVAPIIGAVAGFQLYKFLVTEKQV